MIDVILLGLLAAVDFIKKEIHIFILLPVMVSWLAMSIWNNGINISGIIVAALLAGVSIFTKQAFGMADAIVLSLIAIKNGVMDMLIIFFIANIIFLIFAGVKFGFKQRNREIPFIPFIFIAFIFVEFILKEGI